MPNLESQKLSPKKQNSRPTIGVALSGGSSRAITQIGVLEVFAEHKIPIDYIVGCSSGAFVAAAFANNKMPYLKKWMYGMSLGKAIRMWTLASQKGGLFELGDGEEVLNKLTEGLTFENSRPKLGFTAADVNSGELITVSLGEVKTGIKASIAIPGLFPPVVWVALYV